MDWVWWFGVAAMWLSAGLGIVMTLRAYRQYKKMVASTEEAIAARTEYEEAKRKLDASRAALDEAINQVEARRGANVVDLQGFRKGKPP